MTGFVDNLNPKPSPLNLSMVYKLLELVWLKRFLVPKP